MRPPPPMERGLPARGVLKGGPNKAEPTPGSRRLASALVVVPPVSRRSPRVWNRWGEVDGVVALGEPFDGRLRHLHLAGPGRGFDQLVQRPPGSDQLGHVVTRMLGWGQGVPVAAETVTHDRLSQMRVPGPRFPGPCSS
jgi:hypothetical protein